VAHRGEPVFGLSRTERRDRARGQRSDSSSSDGGIASPKRVEARYFEIVLTFDPAQVPLVNWPDGTVRVAGTRVLLWIVLGAARDGATPEEIADRYTTVSVEAARAILTWARQNQAEADAHLDECEAQGEAIREECERTNPQTGLRARLLARRASRGS
jgi:uncharacterized protein (DUF433 family)